MCIVRNRCNSDGGKGSLAGQTPSERLSIKKICLDVPSSYIRPHCTETIFYMHYHLHFHPINIFCKYWLVCVGLTKLQRMLLHWHYICRFSPLQTSLLKYWSQCSSSSCSLQSHCNQLDTAGFHHWSVHDCQWSFVSNFQPLHMIASRQCDVWSQSKV